MRSFKSFLNVGKQFDQSLSIRKDKKNKRNRPETSYGTYSKIIINPTKVNFHIRSNKFLKFLEFKVEEFTKTKSHINSKF